MSVKSGCGFAPVKLKTVSALFLLFLFLAVPAAFADSWSERPDIDFYAHPFVEDSQEAQKYESGKVLSENGVLFAKIKDKKYPLDIYNIRVVLSGGERVVCVVEDGRAGVLDYDRTRVMALLIFLFTAGVIGMKVVSGFRAAAALLFSLVAVFGFYVPSLLTGAPPVALGIFICLVISLVTLYAVAGRGKKASAALAGAFFGILSAAFTAYIFIALVKTRGYSDEQLQLLNYLSRTLKIPPGDAGAVFLAGLVIAASGVIMDVAITISSSLSSIQSANPLITRKKLFRRGMNIGGDVIASMSGSLLFAYAGGALFLILSRSFFDYSATYLFNAEWVAVIISGIFSGTCGMIVTVPVTGAAAAFLMVQGDVQASLFRKK
ncbi:MAG: YibE/F family protein [Elusimicrobiota bacterium]|nr:YibE/F family protein [Elusimicrobiota bacterium]